MVLPSLTDIQDILNTHPYLPYLIVLIWTFFEGETIVIIAGVAARDNHPWLPLVILAAFCGGLCGDQLAFFLGRYRGKDFVAKRPWLQRRAEKVYRMLEKHQFWLIMGFRFLYGLRNITPFAIGMSEVRTRRFLLLNATGAAVWATTFALGGYLFGLAMETFLAKHQKPVAIVIMLVAVLVMWIVRMLRRRKLKRQTERELLAQATIPGATAQTSAIQDVPGKPN